MAFIEAKKMFYFGRCEPDFNISWPWEASNISGDKIGFTFEIYCPTKVNLKAHQLWKRIKN